MRTFTVLLLLSLSFLLISCTSPQQRAQKLYKLGRYQEVVETYGDLPIADSARVQLAHLLKQETSTSSTSVSTVQSDHMELLTAVIFAGYIARDSDVQDEGRMSSYLMRAKMYAERIHQNR